MSRPEVREIAWLKETSLSSAVVWATPSVLARITRELGIAPVRSLDEVPESADTLIVVGGGGLMDQAKRFRARLRPDLRLILAPSIWGSGAEISPIVVLNANGVKEISIGEEFLPDAVVYWPELLETVSAVRARHACGDAWSHALEAFLSPLGCERVKNELAGLIAEMTQLPLSADPRWFGVSARACRLQAKSSVGLAHGIAHVLEHPLRVRYPDQDWGHAKLCSVFLLPVMELNRESSAKWADLTRQYGLSDEVLWAVLHQLFEPAGYAQALPVLKENWTKILRDPCTRTNGVLIRQKHIEFFERVAA